MDVVAVVGAGEATRVGWAVGVPAVDQLGRTQPPLHGGDDEYTRHTVTAIATDSGGQTAVATITVRVGDVIT